MKTALLPMTMAFSLAVCAGELPVTDGLTTHIDASGATSDNFELDADGTVVAWKDLVDNGNEYRNDCGWNTKFSRPGPVYDSNAFGGKGGVRFGYRNGAYTQTGLSSTEYLQTNRTIFVVCMIDASAPTGGNYKNPVLSRYGMGSGMETAINTDTGGHWHVNPAQGDLLGSLCYYINGVCCIDQLRGYTNSLVGKIANVPPNYYWSGKGAVNVRGEPVVLTTRADQQTCPDEYCSLFMTKFDEGLLLGSNGSYNSSYSVYFFAGWLGEVVTYDRALSDSELVAVQSYLMDKWGANESQAAVRSYAWTGAGGDGKWSTAANWIGQALPEGTSPDSMATIGDATVSVTAEDGIVSWAQLLSNGGHLALSGAVTLYAAPDVTMNMPAGSTIAGTLTKTGAGTLKFDDAEGDFSTATLYVKAGKIDIAGGDFTFANVKAEGGIVVNSAKQTATLTLQADENETAELSAFVQDNVNIVKSGSGDLTIGSFLENTGTNRLSSGDSKLKMVDQLPSLPGVNFHLDASKPETIATNEFGCVWKWEDVANPSLNFTTNSQNIEVPGKKVFGLPYSMPTYDKNAFGGKGGVRFGFTKLDPARPDGVYTQQFLTCGSHILKNLTIVAVVWLDPDATRETCPAFGTSTGHVLSRPAGSGYDSSILLTGGGGSWRLNAPALNDTTSPGVNDNAFWRNGKCYIDIPNGFKASGVNVDTKGNYTCAETATKGVPHVVVFRSIQSAFTDSYRAIYHGNPQAGNDLSLVMGRSGSLNYLNYMLAGWIGELITYDHMLTDDQVMAVQKALIKKWGITDLVQPIGEPNGQLSPSSTLCFEKDASLDLNGSTQTVAAVSLEGSAEAANGALVASSLIVNAAADRTVPCLTVDEGWDLTGMSVDFTGKPAPGSVFLRATGASAFAGPFAETHGWPIKCRGKSVKLAGGGILLLVR